MSNDFTVKPRIFVFLTNPGLEESIQFLLYGIEEEGIPYEVQVVEASDAVSAAYQSATTSSLITGVGCDGEKVVLHYKNLDPNDPYLVIDRYQTKPKEQLKAFGSNCARLVKGVPFKELSMMEVKE
ncbi:glycerol dehydratase reactivase beta/small subunit family protein [Enterococcus sp. AZ109]|uniref:glycerol dehydratase reactivase beta/small subunit family protein n=1 Tax=Enterococcus sp. AZ109 TaxID=2774634 RepID=UPI003F258F81